MLLVLLFLLLLAPPARAGERWRWPVQGPVTEPFHLGSDPFAAGQHRGIDIAAARGTPVRAACSGPVAFAGTVGTAGKTVSVQCGELTATYLHLASIAVRRGETVTRGQRIGAVGTTGHPRGHGSHLHFGVRRTSQRFAYVDPLSLLGDDPLGPAPAPVPLVAPRRNLPEARPVPPAGAPVTVWAGVGLLALAVPGLAVVGARQSRRRRRERLASAAAIGRRAPS